MFSCQISLLHLSHCSSFFRTLSAVVAPTIRSCIKFTTIRDIPLSPLFLSLSMDFHLKQWRRRQDESELRHSVKHPKLLDEPNTITNLLTPLPDSPSSSPSPRSFPRMWGCFSFAQRQELELQALIFRYILAGADVPSELLQPIKKSLLHSPPCFFHHPLQTAYLQPSYWGRAAMDPEPGRCRRTDGKKWRCSRDVVSGHKYCERHVHRGRNRSRKPVETSTPTTNSISPTGAGLACFAGGTSTADAIAVASQTLVAAAAGTPFGLSRPSPAVDLHRFHQSYCDPSTENSNAAESPNKNKVEAGKSNGHVLRHFIDDWPRSFQNSDDGGNNSGQMNSAISLSISTPELPSPSDVSLKLSTGGDQAPGSWGGWALASMGGPLAEALRSSNSYSSPTSVLHRQPRCSASETSVVTS